MTEGDLKESSEGRKEESEEREEGLVKGYKREGEREEPQR